MRMLFFSMLLAGCASAPWVKSGFNESDFAIDSGQCQSQAFSAGAGSAPRQLIYNACMQGKGWEQRRT